MTVFPGTAIFNENNFILAEISRAGPQLSASLASGRTTALCHIFETRTTSDTQMCLSSRECHFSGGYAQGPNWRLQNIKQEEERKETQKQEIGTI
jgi:hypothetical protein